MDAEKPNLNNYEIMCLFQEEEKSKKEELIKKIQQVSDKLEKKDLKTEKLASWPSWSVKVENYLLFHLTTSSKKIQQIERIIQQQRPPVQYLLINLDKEKRIKIKKRPLNSQNFPPESSLGEEKPTPSSGLAEENQSIE